MTELSRLSLQTAKQLEVLERPPNAIPKDGLEHFESTLEYLRKRLQDAQKILKSLEDGPFGVQGSPGFLEQQWLKAKRISRANLFYEKMNSVDHILKEVSGRLMNIASDLTLSRQIDNQVQHQTGKPKYTASFSSAPGITHSVYLELHDKQEDEMPRAPEAKLKHSILVANRRPLGLPAMGSLDLFTELLEWLASVRLSHCKVLPMAWKFDKDLKTAFTIYHMSLGRQATVQSVVRAVAEIIRISGGRELSEKIDSVASATEPVNCAVDWFSGKSCLFLIDNLWPTNKCKTGFLKDLRLLLRSCNDSQMVITTRSHEIEQEAGEIITVDEREPTGFISNNIFLSHAICRKSFLLSFENCEGNNVIQVLKLCAGLPLALAVAGRAVARLTRFYGGFHKGCEEHALRLQKNLCWLSAEEISGEPSLSAKLDLSLEILENELHDWNSARRIQADLCMKDIFESLSVLQPQAWAPLPLLRRIWRIEEDGDACTVIYKLCGMSLAMADYRPVSEEILKRREQKRGAEGMIGIRPHDLHLEYAQQSARLRNREEIWHLDLLNGHMNSSTISDQHETNEEMAICVLPHQEWWSDNVPNDRYIHTNLGRHLVSGGLGMELCGLPLDARWVKNRRKIRGVLALEHDFENAAEVFRNPQKHDGLKHDLQNMTADFKLIFKTLKLISGKISKNPYELPFQACGRLFVARSSSKIIESFARIVEKYAERPYLSPMNMFMEDPQGAQVMEVPVGGFCETVAYSACGKYLAAGVFEDNGLRILDPRIVILDALAGSIIREFLGHSCTIKSIAFIPHTSKVVSGSRDRMVRIWDIDSYDEGSRVLRGHTSSVECVAASLDGLRVVSCCRDCTIRFWDARCATCTKRPLIKQPKSINAVAFSPDGAFIASGSDDCTVRLWDSRSGEPMLGPFQGHKFSVLCVAISPNGEYIASGSGDLTVRKWHIASSVATGQLPRTYGDSVLSVTFSPGGGRIAVCSED